MIYTESYVTASYKTIVTIGETYYFGELWNGEGGSERAKEILKSGAVAMYDTILEDYKTVKFEVVTSDRIASENLVIVTDIY